MKKALLLIVISLLFCAATYAQSVPQGMKYQAVARDLAGNIIADQPISLKISLVTTGKSSTVYYTEVHKVTTNQLGLFSLVIGEGKVDKGVFTAVPWSTDEIWMQVSIKDKNSFLFTTISNSKLLAVPYAFHAGTASQLVNTKESGFNIATPGIASAATSTTSTGTSAPGGTWLLGGNLKTNPISDYIGTADAVDLVFRTNKTERLRITAAGDIDFKNKLTVGNDLIVKQNVQLNTVGGTTDIKGATNLQSTLNVTGATILKNSLYVTNASATNLSGTLTVSGATALNNKVDIVGVTKSTNNTESTLPSNGALVVTGGVGIGGNLNVGGTTNIAGTIDISGNESTFMATFENKNEGEGDGLKIKLGRAKSTYTIPAAPDLGASDMFADLLNCEIPETQKVTTLLNIVKDDAIETGKTMAGIAVSAGNMIVNVINSELNLPLSIPDIIVPNTPLAPAVDVSGKINQGMGLPINLPRHEILPEIDFGVESVGPYYFGGFKIVPDLPPFSIPAVVIPKTTLLSGREVMPKLPKIGPIPGIPEVDIASLKFWGLDINFCLDEGSSSPLNNSNEFIHFADKNDAQVGSIRGVSVANWSANFLNPIFFNKLRGAFVSSKVDKFHAQYHFKQEISTALASYAKIGVEYSSGNGDYAEWLERTDKMEVVSAGDIVSVKGGKITKNLLDAEQIMVVSHAPIMLGNMPAANKKDLGNSIVFIGQAPVKIMGPVASGDYIIGQIATPGYGIAKHPNDMTVEDFKLAVGRSWDTDNSNGLKLVNTVIGVHNSNFLNLIKDLKEKADTNEGRLMAIEAKLGIAAPVKTKFTAAKTKK